MASWLASTSLGALSLGITVFLIVVALMIFHEAAKALLPRSEGRLSDGLMSMTAGLFLGLVYGAGVIIKAGREGNLDKKDLFLIALFLSSCHAVVEDTILFVAVGGNFFWILGTRLVVAVTVTAAAFLLGKLPPRKGKID